MFAFVYALVADLCDIINPYILPFFGVGLILYTIAFISFLIGGKRSV